MERLSIRFDNHTMLKLSEISSALNTNYSLLIRTIVKSWIESNEQHIDNIIDITNNNKELINN